MNLDKAAIIGGTVLAATLIVSVTVIVIVILVLRTRKGSFFTRHVNTIYTHIIIRNVATCTVAHAHTHGPSLSCREVTDTPALAYQSQGLCRISEETYV